MEHCAYKENLHRSKNHESSTNDGRDATMEYLHNDGIQQLVTSDFFVDSNMLDAMFDNLQHYIANVGSSIPQCNSIDNITNPTRSMHAFSFGTTQVLQVNFFS